MKDRRGLRVNHKQVRIKHRGRDVEVDELLAPVIRDLWRQGFRTVSSCGRPRLSGLRESDAPAGDA